MAITKVRVGLHTDLWIPSSWDRFLYRGFLYVRQASGRYVTERAWSRAA